MAFTNTNAVLNGSVLDGACTFYSGLFQAAFAGDTVAGQNYTRYVREISNPSKFVQIPLVTCFPKLRLWEGKKVSKLIRAETITIQSKDYEATFPVSKIEYKLDKQHVGEAIAMFLGQQVGEINRVVVEKLITANTEVGRDGVAVCSDSHPRDDGSVQDNYTTLAFSQVSYRAAKAAMEAFTDRVGKPLGVKVRKLIIGTANADVARDVLVAKQRVQGMTAAGLVDASSAIVAAAAIENMVSMDGVEIIVEPLFSGTSANYWFLVGELADGAPIVLNQAEPLHPVDNVNEFSKDNAMYLFGVEGVLGCEFGLWETIYGGFAS